MSPTLKVDLHHHSSLVTWIDHGHVEEIDHRRHLDEGSHNRHRLRCCFAML